MSDPFSVAAGIAGLITLSGTVLSQGYSYLASVRRAPQELRLLLSETAALNTVLDQVQIVMDSRSSSKTAVIYQDLIKTGAINDCKELLKSVQTSIIRCQQIEGHDKRNFGKALIWPFKERETKETLQRLCRLRDIFTTALSVDTVATLQRIEKTETEITTNVNDIRHTVAQLSSNERYRRIYQWLCPAEVEVEQRHEAALKLRQDGTGGWFLQSEIFRGWLRARNAFMWLSGIPGSGKTVLSAAIIEYLELNHRSTYTGLAYFYCDSKNPEKQRSVRDLLATTIIQLSKQNSQCMAEIETLLDTTYQKDINKRLKLDDLESLLHSVSTHFGRTLIILDALDECNDLDLFVERLKQLNSSSIKSTNIQILVTSRHEINLERLLLSHAKFHLKLSKADVLNDIHTYVSAEMDARISSGKLKLRQPNLRTDIISSLTARADGMFLWAKLQLDHICSLKTDKAIRNALGQLPRGLDSTYVQIFQRIEAENRENIDEVKRLFRWLVGSIHPLSLEQLAEAISIQPEDTRRDMEAIATDPEDLLTICGCLVTISPFSRRSVVTFAHLSVKEFITSPTILASPAATFYVDPSRVSFELAETCIQYLSFSDFASPCHPDEKIKDRVSNYPLLVYATSCWLNHLAHCQAFDEDTARRLESRLRWFLQPDRDGCHYTSWQQVLYLYPSRSMQFVDISSPLYYGARLGSEYLVDLLISRGTDVNAWLHRGTVALHEAASSGHLNVVKKLLEAGANMDIQIVDRGLTAIHFAAEEGHADVVEVLLAAGSSINSRSTSGATPFYRAARSGSMSTVELLWARGSDVNASTWDNWTPIFEAIEKDHPSVVSRLIEWGADLRVETLDGFTPLGFAKFLERTTIVNMLEEQSLKGNVPIQSHSYLSHK